MNRDLIVHHLVAIDAQLRRMRRLAVSLGAAELKARLPALVEETTRGMQRVMSSVGQDEGWQAGPGGPRTD